MKRKFLILTMIGFLLISGCAALRVVDTDQQNARSVVDIVTLAAIEQATDRQVTARKIIQAAEDARTWIDFDGVTIEDLVVKARARLAVSDLELSSKAALTLLITRLESSITEKVGAGLLDPDAKVTVNRLLDWIVVSAQAYAS